MMKIKYRYVIITIFLFNIFLSTETTAQLLSDEKNTIAVFKKVSPLVVNVHNLQSRMSYDGIYNIQKGVGSGFIWNKQGYIVTNYHVVADANKIAVTLNHGKTVYAKFVGGEPRKDIAVLKINMANLTDTLKNTIQPLAVANSSNLKVGQKVIAVGNPFGLDRTLTTGVISALGRKIPGFSGIRIHDMIQTDASINPGNSGGPLVDSEGKLIGVNTMIYSNSGSSAGVGFAVPTNDIKRIVSQLIKFGKVRQAGLGVKLFNDQVSQRFGIKGVLIDKVFSGTPAASVGLRGTMLASNGQVILGDIITGINSLPIKSYDDLYNALANINVGETIKVNFIRNNQLKSVSLETIDVF